MQRNMKMQVGDPTVTRVPTDDPLRARLLDEAKRLTTGERNIDYGRPIDNMADIARIFNAITGRDISAAEVPMFHMATKLARMRQSPGKHDHYVDLMAYAGITAECVEAELSE